MHLVRAPEASLIFSSRIDCWIAQSLREDEPAPRRRHGAEAADCFPALAALAHAIVSLLLLCLIIIVSFPAIGE